MLHGFSGSPGTGKTLNAIKYIIENDHFAARPVYYHGIRVLLLDFDSCNSFQGWLYGVYYPANLNNTTLKNKLLKIDKERRLAELDDFPYLAYEFKKHDPVALWVLWFKRVASDYRLNLFNEALIVLGITEEQLTGDIIKSLGLSWNNFYDPTLIHELPSGSIILTDEVQNIWPTRQSNKEPSPDVQFSSTHRHNAQDLVYVSQDFRDVDQFIRRRIAHYTHFEFLGGDWLCRYHSNNLFDPSSKADLARVGHEKIKRDNKFYGLYLSSIDHTHKVGLSASMRKALKLAAFSFGVLFIGVAALFQTPLFAAFFSSDDVPDAAVSSSSSQVEQTQVKEKPVSNSVFQPAASSVGYSMDDINGYVNQYNPRHAAIPWSAPVFDAVTIQPQSYPSLTCVQTESRCVCFTQQMTTYDISFNYCSSIASRGFFDPFRPDIDQRSFTRSQRNNNQTITQQTKGAIQ